MHDTGYLSSVVFLLAAAVIIVATFRYLRISPVLGYLVAGAAIGPFGLGVVTDVGVTSSIAEVGVVFLLFMIGLELSLNRLREMRTYVFGLGGLQVLLTSLVIGGIAYMLGQSAEASIIIGGALALSSTAIVLQVVGEMGEQTSQVGRLSLSVLLLQDFAVIPLLVLIPLFASGAEDGIITALGGTMIKALIALVVIFFVGRLILRPLFRIVARACNAELFVATTLLVVLGTSYATEHFGLSLALGAFIAGLLVAETEFRHQVEVDTTPFKGLFLGLFFMAVGMSLDIQQVLSQFWLVMGMAAGYIVIKLVVLGGLCRVFGVRNSIALHTAMLMAQGSEFAFVVFGLASQSGTRLMDPTLSQLLVVMVTVSMALTPLLALGGQALRRWIEKRSAIRTTRTLNETKDLDNHIIIAGYGRMGTMLAKVLTRETMRFVAIDLDPNNVSRGRKEKMPVYYGNARRPEVLQAVGVERAEMIVFTFTESREVTRAIAEVKRHYPQLTVLARAFDEEHYRELKSAGADVVVLETLEASLHLGSALLRVRGISQVEIARVTDEFRQAKSEKIEGTLLPTPSHDAVPEPASQGVAQG